MKFAGVVATGVAPKRVLFATKGFLTDVLSTAQDATDRTEFEAVQEITKPVEATRSSEVDCRRARCQIQFSIVYKCS